jgi:acetoin utilization protein AcuB
MKPNVTLERYMTRHPHSIRFDEKLKVAAELMDRLHVRHLPVLNAGQLVGVLSDRDLKLVARSADGARVEDACVDEPFAVDVDTSLWIVADTMAKKRIGSTIVLEGGKVVGIFTVTDACRALADMLTEGDAGARMAQTS